MIWTLAAIIWSTQRTNYAEALAEARQIETDVDNELMGYPDDDDQLELGGDTNLPSGNGHIRAI